MSWPRQALIDLLGIEHPIIQAPMAGASTAALAAAVSNAGALGGFGGTDFEPGRTARGHPRHSSEDQQALHHQPLSRSHRTLCSRCRARGRTEDGSCPGTRGAAMRARFPIRSTCSASSTARSRLWSRNGCPCSPATSVLRTRRSCARSRPTARASSRRRRQLKRHASSKSAGVDAIIAQGSEAGGHRGTFAAPAGQAEIGTMALVPQIVDAVSVPVIAAGGIMDGRGIAAALMLGASGVQMGTAFVPCPETAVNPAYVRAPSGGGAGRCGSHRCRFRQTGSPASKQACRSPRAEPRPSPRVSRAALDDSQSSQGCRREAQRRVPADVGRSGGDAGARDARRGARSAPFCRRRRRSSQAEPRNQDRSMTPRQITLVQQSFAKVLPIRETAAALFYDRLFAIDPSTRPLFPADMPRRAPS